MSSLAGQQTTNQAIGNKHLKPSLLVSIPQILQANLGTLRTPSPLSLSFVISPQASSPLKSIFFDWSESLETDEEGSAQIITIAPGKPFYHPPTITSPSTPKAAERESNTFACGALAESKKKTPAQLFHEELERMQDQAIVFDTEEIELERTPVQVVYTDSWRALPDVPQDFDPVSCSDLEDMVEDLEDEEDEDYSSEEVITPLPQAVFTPISLGDKRLVVPFDYDTPYAGAYMDVFLEKLLHQDSD